MLYNAVVLKKKNGKTFKNCSFRTLFRKKQAQHRPHPESCPIFLEITKENQELFLSKC